METTELKIWLEKTLDACANEGGTNNVHHASVGRVHSNECYIYIQGVSQASFDDVYVIFPIHLNFPIRYVLKAIIHRKKQWIILRLLEKVFFFFQKDTFYDFVHACGF